MSQARTLQIPDPPSPPAGTDRVRPALAARLREATGADSFAQIARRTGFNHETVRRYLSGRVVSIQFVVAVARAYGVSADWLLLGRGAMRAGPWPPPRITGR